MTFDSKEKMLEKVHPLDIWLPTAIRIFTIHKNTG